jgi:hypothetical protein
MAQSVTKQLLSASTNGKGILLTGTTTPGILLHTAVAGSSSLDEVYLYAYNGHTSDVVVTVEWGEATVPNGNIIVTIPSKSGRFMITDGRLLQNSLTVRGFASVANVVVIDGFVNSIT